MDEDEAYSETRDELLKRFRESLTKPLSERYFDIDDLIEVFDYAGDVNDDYLRIEALMCGARYFPDSEALLERRAIFYSQYSQRAQNQFIQDNPSNGNLILDFIALKSENLTVEEAQAAVERLIDTHPAMNDEEVIQFIDLCSFLNIYPWLKQRFDYLRSKVEYVNVLLYEAAIIAEYNKDIEFCTALLEELTQEEPFNSFYWMMLSRQYASMEDWAKAVNAIDYSLAINPDAPQSLLMKAKLYYALDKPIEDIEQILLRAIEISNGDLECVKYLASIYADDGRADKGRDLLLETISSRDNDNDIEIIPELILYRPKQIDTLLDRFYNATTDNSQIMWSSWAQQLSIQGYPDVAKSVIDCYARHTGVSLPTLFIIEDAFRTKQFKEVIEYIDQYTSSMNINIWDSPSLQSMRLISLLKSGKMDEAREFCKAFERKAGINLYHNVSNRLEFIGLHYIVWEAKRNLEQNAPADFWLDFDPLKYWSQDNK